MSFLQDIKILWHLAFKPVRGKTHQQRLESFYQGQASGYDQFRERLLHGREELYRSIPVPRDGVWVDLGGGTGSNLEFISDRIEQLKQVYVVDLSPSLLKVASERIEQRGWKSTKAIEADATTFQPEQLADVVTFSYSLTMIPDWTAAIEQAERILKPGGVIGVVDFYVSRKYPEPGLKTHGWMTRTLWPAWFGFDNVFLSPDHLPCLRRKFEQVSLVETKGRVPCLPLVTVPHYRFVGRKKD